MQDTAALTTAIAILATGCATAMPPQSPEGAPLETITLRVPGDMEQATIEGSRFFGPEWEVTRYDRSLRGHSPTGLVDLRAENDTIEGMIGTGRTELHLDAYADDGFRLRGLFGGSLGALDVRSDRIQGQLGGCQYDLHQATAACETTYSGLRACGRRLPEPAELTLTPAVASLDPLDRAALLAIFLGR